MFSDRYHIHSKCPFWQRVLFIAVRASLEGITLGLAVVLVMSLIASA